MSADNSKEPSAWARAKAFNALTRHSDCLKDDTVMNDLIDEIATALDEAKVFGAQAAEGTLTAVVHIVGGKVEGHPTSRINVLQRLRAMRAFEESWEIAR